MRGAVRADVSVTVLIAALTVWGLFKGLYDANIFASVFDVVRPEARGTAAGFMNAIGWLAGGGSAPLVIGLIAERSNLGLAITLTSLVYVMAAVLLAIGLSTLGGGAWGLTPMALIPGSDPNGTSFGQMGSEPQMAPSAASSPATR